MYFAVPELTQKGKGVIGGEEAQYTPSVQLQLHGSALEAVAPTLTDFDIMVKFLSPPYPVSFHQWGKAGTGTPLLHV